jgi:putative membrane protein
MKVEELFRPEAHDRIERAVQQAERQTAGEIVPMVVPRSGDYTGLRAVLAAALAFGTGLVVLALPIEPTLWLPPAEVASFAAAFLGLGWAPVLRLLIPERARATAVDRAARLAFLEHDLVETRDRTGILIYISLLEHRVCVLADRGIDERVEPGTWDGVVETILRGIRARRAEEGLVDAIAACGAVLAQSFPARADDTDEISNRLRT